MTNKLGIMLEILNNYPWTRLSVRIIGVIKGKFFHMVMHVFDNSTLPQEICAIDTCGAVICSLGHCHKHILTILPILWRPGLISFHLPSFRSLSKIHSDRSIETASNGAQSVPIGQS